MSRRNRRGIVAGVALLATLGLSACRPEKKLIEFGWDEPDTAFMRRHIEQMERSPFDGCVFHLSYRGPQGGEGNFTWQCWGRRAFGIAELKPALDDLKATRVRRFTHNFLRFNTTPGDVDWFDDFAAILGNARLAARIAREGGCKGIMLDDEQYEGQLFDYRRQRDAAKRSWDEYAAQARRRGRELMLAFQQEYPRLTVFLTFGHSLPWLQMQREGKPLKDVSYGLLAPFLDGLVEGARRGRIVDGHELSYWYKEPERFATAQVTAKSALLPIVASPQKYSQVVSLGFGLWMDYDWRRNGWDPDDVSKNYFTPEAFETSVRAALQNTDEYVWIYTETPRWWSAEGTTVKLPAAYDAAIRRARESLRSAPPPAAGPGSRGAP
jgi:hypothetical protein